VEDLYEAVVVDVVEKTLNVKEEGSAHEIVVPCRRDIVSECETCIGGRAGIVTTKLIGGDEGVGHDVVIDAFGNDFFE
jgi:hypothetical protein